MDDCPIAQEPASERDKRKVGPTFMDDKNYDDIFPKPLPNTGRWISARELASYNFLPGYGYLQFPEHCPYDVYYDRAEGGFYGITKYNGRDRATAELKDWSDRDFQDWHRRVSVLLRPVTPPNKMIPDPLLAYNRTTVPRKNRHFKPEEEDEDFTNMSNESLTQQLNAISQKNFTPAPLMISKSNTKSDETANMEASKDSCKTVTAASHQSSGFPTESLLAILNQQQQAIKTENSSNSSIYNGKQPASRGNDYHRPPPTVESLDGSSSSVGGGSLNGVPPMPGRIPKSEGDALRDDLFTKQQDILAKEQMIHQIHISKQIYDTVTSPQSSGDYQHMAFNPRATMASRPSWAPQAEISPVEYARPTAPRYDGFMPPSQHTQGMWSDGSLRHAVAPTNITAMNALTTSMGNFGMGNSDWASVTPVQGMGMSKAAYNNQQTPMGNQAEFYGYAARPQFDRTSYPSAVAGTPGFNNPAATTFGSQGVTVASAYPMPNDPSAMYTREDSYRPSMGNGYANRPVSAGGNFGGRAPYNGYQNGAVNAYNNSRGVQPAMNNYYTAPQGLVVPQGPAAAYGGPRSAPLVPGPVGSRLSPTASEFSYNGLPSPWNSQVSDSLQFMYANTDGLKPSSMTYGSNAPAEPLNYRRLLDRNANCDWSIIVHKIIDNNDQQASIFLQQKLKMGTNDQKYEIVDAIIAQAYLLMINRFGNFLVQRCFEHGTDEQIIKIAQAIQGHTLDLSMDAFGCHVIQKAFDCVPENYKAVMVHELLRRIPETVVHRYACHVWQKLFELRWSDSPPQIMKFVNDALRGMWHEVALGETGSLVVQNIFENCLDEDKRPCIDEIILSIDVVAHGQFGNWCIQHICEHGAPKDRNRAIDHILRFATNYSMDQYASKVIEKCLKIGGDDFLERYLDRVCEIGPEATRGPRIPLIDISSDQFGNYLIQWILVNVQGPLRETVANHIRKHMVSLRGSKYGSRVAMLCCNPAFACRPGAPNLLPQANQAGSIGNGYGNGYGNGGYGNGGFMNHGNRYAGSNGNGNGYRQNSLPNYR
ncbi:ARM repeat-containing protein [Tothia fuscella]|uniref:ARM repeat-containing protein n=1 Tax=Tothia fuscella TaxID=1048955 RepID=A0A9P4TWJ7_9PEZI|nr:ARM repeat-containing protein [Tothia fuscella]